MRTGRSIVLETSLRTVFFAALLFSLYLLFVGHNAPGGGFVGGLVAGVAFLLAYAAGGPDEVERVVPIRPATLIGIGLMVAVLTGVGGWLFGGSFLESAKLEAGLPLLGTVKTTTALAFDAGVYLLVAGLVLAVLRSLGREDAGEEERA